MTGSGGQTNLIGYYQIISPRGYQNYVNKQYYATNGSSLNNKLNKLNNYAYFIGYYEN